MPGPAYDVVLADDTVELPLQLAPDSKGVKQIKTGWAPSSAGLSSFVYRDFSNGYGYSQPGIVTNGYGYGTTTASDFGGGIDARSPGVVMPAGAITEVDISGIANTSVINDSFSLGSDHYFLAGRKLIKILSGYSTVSQVADAGSGERYLYATVAAYGGTPYAWIGIAGATGGFAKYDGTTLTTTTSFVRGHMGKVYWATTDGVTVQRLIGTDSSFSIKHCPLTSDPMTAGNWSASITAGEGTSPIGSIVSTGRHVYLSTAIGLYDLDDLGQTVNLAPYHGDSTSIYNGVAAYYWDGYVLYGADTGIDAIDISQPGVKQAIANWALPGAAVGIPNETPIFGRPIAFTNDAGWVAVAVTNGTDSYVLYGKRRARLGIPGPGEWVWHGPLAVFKSLFISHMTVRTVVQAGVPSRRLWIATAPIDGGSTPRLFYQSLPLTTTSRQDAINNTAHRYATGCKLYLTPADWGQPELVKRLATATFDSPSFGASNTLALAASTDDVTFGSTLATVSDPDDAKFAVASVTAPIEGTRITPLVTFAGTATVPTVLRSLLLQAAVDPDADEVYDFDVILSREDRLNHGGARAHSTPETDYEDLALMQGRYVTLTIPPIEGAYTALIHVGTPGALRQVTQGDGTRSWVRTVNVTATIVDRPARYGESRYGIARYG